MFFLSVSPSPILSLFSDCSCEYVCAHRARKVHQAFPSLPIVARCHHYEIKFKFLLQCTNPHCGFRGGRHTKPRGQLPKCRRCGSATILIQTNQADGNSSPPKSSRLNPFALFVKKRFGLLKKQHPKLTHGEIMRQLGAEYKQQQQQQMKSDEK